MNVSNGDNVKRGSNEVLRRAPYLNVLVNNAGVIFSGIVDETMLKDQEKTITVNLTGTFLVTKYFLPLLKKAPWTSIINMASITGQTGNVAANGYYQV